jgi:hypothetical protein
VALAIDTTRAVRGPAARLALVNAVLEAPEHEPEHSWIEWKLLPDIRAARALIARTILGFANREVAAAQRQMEGCAYIVIGASPPGQLVGVTPADPADLENWIAPFVGGAQGPAWEADYVSVGERVVLVITVEAPRYGDRPWPLRKEWNQLVGGKHVVMHENSRFTRRNGSTVHANVAEEDMLWERGRAGASHLQVTVKHTGEPAARAFTVSRSALTAWADGERERLLKPLEEALAAKQRNRPLGRGMLSPFLASGEDDPLGLINKYAAGLGALAVGLGHNEPEDRTEEAYRKEVEQYVARGVTTYEGAGEHIAVHRRLAVLQLEVHNPTDIPYLGVSVTIHAPGPVHGWWASEGAPKEPLPKAPRPWGPRFVAGTLESLRYSTHFGDFGIAPLAARPPRRGKIDNSGSVRVKYLPFDLLAGDTKELADLALALPESMAGSSIKFEWAAACSNVQGHPTGTLEWQVEATPAPVSLTDE